MRIAFMLAAAAASTSVGGVIGIRGSQAGRRTSHGDDIMGSESVSHAGFNVTLATRDENVRRVCVCGVRGQRTRSTEPG